MNVAQSRVTNCLLPAAGLLLAASAPAAAAGPDHDVEWDGLFSDTTTQFVAPRVVEAGGRVTLRMRAYAFDLTAATCRAYFAGPDRSVDVPMSIDATRSDEVFDVWQCEVLVPGDATEVYYRFLATDGDDTDFLDAGAPGDPWAVRGVQDDERAFFDFRLYPGFSVPAWSEGAVFYQIFPDRFANGRRSNDRVFPDDCFWYLDFAPASPEAAACAAYDVPAAPAGYDKRCLVQDDWHAAPNGGPCDFFGGDLAGIDRRLEYLEDLGATALYLNPVFRSPSNHKYDTLDYTEIDPRFGTLADLDTLTRRLHARDMAIIVDGVFNHVSDLGEIYGGWTNYAYDAGRASGIDAYAETCGAWEQVFLSQAAPGQQCTSEYANWFRLWVGQDTWDVDRDGDRDEAYAHTCGWAGLGFMPEIDFGDPGRVPDSGPRAWLYGGTHATDPAVARATVAGEWLADGARLTEGLDGWRLDVPDNAGFFTEPAGCAKQAADPTIWQGFRRAVKAVGEDKYISGEIWTDASDVGGWAQDWFRQRTYDTVMNYHFFGTPVACFLTGKGVHDDPAECDPFDAMRAGRPASLSALVGHLAEGRRKYPAGAFLSAQNLISSHDSARFASRVGGGDDARSLIRLATFLQIGLPGAAMIYYGDEIATEGANNELGRATFDWRVLEDPSHPRARLREDVRRYACLRGALSSLRTGSMTTLHVDDAAGTWAFSRFTDADRALVVVNTSEARRTVRVSLARFGAVGDLVDALTGEAAAVTDGQVTVDLDARGVAALVPAEQADAVARCRTPNRAPVASLTAASTAVVAGESLRLDATGSADPDGRPLTFQWTDDTGAGLGDGSTLDLSPRAPGPHRYAVRVSDGVYADEASVSVTVAEAPGEAPGGRATPSPPSASGCAASGSGSAGLPVALAALLLARRRRR